MPRKRVPHQHLGPQPDPMKGKTVYFGPPRDVGEKGGAGVSGVIEDEVWAPDIDPHPNASWGEYCFFAQSIRWDSGNHSIRLGYYRRRAGEKHWEFASQTTINSNPRTIQALLERTLAKRAWFLSS
jgi:hypothetical protein